MQRGMSSIGPASLISLLSAVALASCLEPVGPATEGGRDLADLGKAFALDDGSDWVAIGDALFTQDELDRLDDAAMGLTTYSLLGFRQLWTDVEARDLTFCVATSFGDEHASMVAHMLSAAKQWELAAKIRFRYVPDSDDYCLLSRKATIKIYPSPTSLGTSVARPSRIGTQLILMADASPMLHEVGHILGFSHEFRHPDAPSEALECGAQDGFHLLPWLSHQGVGAYDPGSVMHYYLCTPEVRPEYRVSTGDAAQAVFVYGMAVLPYLGDTARHVSEPRKYIALPGRYRLKNVTRGDSSTPPYVWETDRYTVVSRSATTMTIDVPRGAIVTIGGYADDTNDPRGAPRQLRLIEITRL